MAYTGDGWSERGLSDPITEKGMAMQRIVGFAVATVACAMGAVSFAGAEEFTGKVTSVSSGHIIQVEHEGKRDLVVLDGVKSPDSKTPEGKQAKAFVANRALDRDVKVVVVKRSDRIVTGTVFLSDGTDLAQLVLGEGMGSWNRMTAPDNARYRDLEAGAKMQSLGLWGLDTIPSAKPRTPAGRPPGRVEASSYDVSGEAAEPAADGKKPKLVLRGDADVAEAARAEFEREQQIVAEEQARIRAEQERLIQEEEKRIAEAQKKEEAAMIKAEQEAMMQQGIMPYPAPVPPQ